MIYKAYRFDDIPQQVADDIHAFGVMGTRNRIDKPPLLCYNETNNTKGGGDMKNLISSKDNSIHSNGAIGKQKCGIIFWQKTGFLRHCNYLGFQSMITLISKKFSPSNIQNNGESCFFQFDNDDKKIIYLSLQKETNSKHYFIYGESHTVYADSKFHILALDVASYIGKQIGCKFFVDDATDFLEHQSIDKLDEYIDNFEIPSFESPDLLREALKK